MRCRSRPRSTPWRASSDDPSHGYNASFQGEREREREIPPKIPKDTHRGCVYPKIYILRNYSELASRHEAYFASVKDSRDLVSQKVTASPSAVSFFSTQHSSRGVGEKEEEAATWFRVSRARAQEGGPARACVRA